MFQLAPAPNRTTAHKSCPVPAPVCGEWNATRGFATSKELARDILEKVHVAVVPGTDFGVPNDLRLAFCNKRYNEGIDRLRTYFTASIGKKRLPQMQRTKVVAPGAEA